MDCLFQVVKCLVVPFLNEQSVAEIIVGARVVGLETERFAVARGSLVEPAEDLLSDAEIVMILGTGPVAGDGAANEVDGSLVAAGLMCKHAEKVQSAWVLRV